MADPDGDLTVAQRLGRALDRGLLPAGGPAEAAERLIERLERPARLALLGLPGSGKSSILNLLVGSPVVPETLRLPTIVVQHGDVSRMVCTLTDGTTKILPEHDLAEVLPLAPALVTLEIDLPALRVISLLEVSAGPMEAEQKRAATWASKRADIVIWCTTSYLPKEQAVWESLPDAVKDNSFMFLTKVDLLGTRDAALAMHERVELRAGEEFRQILSISAKQARIAMPPGGPVNRDLFRDSGASAVIAAIKTRVQSGRRADVDTAELLLARHVEAGELVARRFAEEDDAPKVWTPPPEPQPTHPVEDMGEKAGEPAAREPEPTEPAPAEPAPADPEPPRSAPAPEPEPDVEPLPAAEPVAEVRPAPAAQPVAEADPPAAAQPAAPPPTAEPEPAAGTRRRFADRIKRVATDGDAGPAPMVPLKTTWKSKADSESSETEAASAPRDATRRPRTAAADAPPQAAAPDPVAFAPPADPPSLADEPTPEAPATEVQFPEPAVDTAPPVADGEVEPMPMRERRPRAVTPRPSPQPDTAAPRAPLFGARRGTGSAGTPLPDLSSLRATPEEMAASAEANAADAPDDAAAEDGWQPPEAETGPTAVEPTVDRRPRLFDHTPRVRPSEPSAPARPVSSGPSRPVPSAPSRPEPSAPSRPEPALRATPIARMPAAARPTAPATAPEPIAARPLLDESQFSPRAIMMRERRVEPDTPAPRRERPRIAARAVAAPSGPAAAAPAAAADGALLDEAIALIVSRSAELEQEIDPEGKVPVDLILDHSRETTERVQALVGRGQSAELRRIGSDLGEVMDLIMLMQLEKGHAPADDALTMLLQLKRELETLRAA